MNPSCKCGHRLEGFGSVTSYRGIQWFHELQNEKVWVKTKKGHDTDKHPCFCGCEFPELASGKAGTMRDALEPRASVSPAPVKAKGSAGK